MAGIISINGDSITQPSSVKEELKQKVHDRITLKGTYFRIWLAQKRQATLVYSAIDNVTYQRLLPYLTGTANPVHYVNVHSGLDFIGFPTVAESEYYQGASLLRDFTVTIVER